MLALCEGRTGLAISGVFGAGKTRSAAALLAGLLVFDPSLQLMVLTKENVAAHAVAEHLVSLKLPDRIQGKMRRLVGYYEQNEKGSYTPLDIPPSNRNQVLRQKSLLIGCGGGFQQECGQHFSPVADWMSSVDLFLEDEGQQYGNMEEAASVARTPATCLEVWSGDAELYERMQASYTAVGRDFNDKEAFIGSEYHKLQRLELVPQRWPLARLSISLQKCVDHLDRVLAGCCWEVHATRADLEESLPSLCQVSKCLTMLLAVYLAKEVAAILREILTHPTKRLYDDNTAHLLCSNYWVQPIYQELLHSSSRYNATRTGEKNRPSNGLARISAHPRPPKKLKPAASGTRFTDWIGGICYADTLQVWFPAHWAPVVLHQLQHKEDEYRTAHPSWMDQEVAPDDIQTQWQEARANRRMQFKVGDYKDSNIRMLTGTLKADWIQLPVERYLAALPTLKQGVITGVFKIKGASPWAITRAEKLQVSVFLPDDLSLDDWYAGVYALPTVWPDVSMMGASNLRRVAGYDFHHIRKKYDVPSMWGNIRPQWRLLQQHLETKGPGWYPLAKEKSGSLPTGLIGLEMI